MEQEFWGRSGAFSDSYYVVGGPSAVIFIGPQAGRDREGVQKTMTATVVWVGALRPVRWLIERNDGGRDADFWGKQKVRIQERAGGNAEAPCLIFWESSKATPAPSSSFFFFFSDCSGSLSLDNFVLPLLVFLARFRTSSCKVIKCDNYVYLLLLGERKTLSIRHKNGQK